jgi:ATP-dependent exoDNAse (exonuclease V) alpha subunit
MFEDVEKYLIKNNTKLFSNSEITYEKPPAGVKAEITHGFTIHAIQGETLGHNDRLYIDVRNMFSDRMIYTAVSRARRCEQVFLIE